MSTLILFIFLSFFAIAVVVLWSRNSKMKRAEYIRTYMFPPGLLDKLAARYPALQLKDRQLVARALRQFFIAYLRSGMKFVSMPSQVVDDLWHEFILYTRHYDAFCRKAFGRFMHHTPAVVLGARRDSNAGLRRACWYCCMEENINPKKATRLPLLFAIDAKLSIANGFHYVLDCKSVKRKGQDSGGTVYCGGDMSSSKFDGSIEGFGDSSGVDAGGSGDSGGCGGGCGGGD